MKTGALILASSAPEGAFPGDGEMPFLPMCPLDGTTVIKREIAALRKLALSPIVVLGGYQKKTLQNHLSHNNVIFIEDQKYRENDREASLQTSLETVRQWMDRVIVIPAEYPVFSIQTLKKLLDCKNSTVPVCNGQTGWPRLYVFQEDNQAGPEHLPVEDQGILLSISDTDGTAQAQQYLKTQRHANGLHYKTKVILSKEEDFFGPGVCRLLRYIDETGSIQAAASKMHMSYSKSWKMVNKVEREMGFSFLNRCNGGKTGGSSTLTDEGRLFIERYQAMRRDVERAGQGFFDTYFKDYQ